MLVSYSRVPVVIAQRHQETPRRPKPLRRSWLRFWAHLTRTRGRASFILGALSIGLYTLLPNEAGASATTETVKQICLIVASVAASAWVLPELSSSLWTMSSEDVRRLIPDSSKQRLMHALVAADSVEPFWSDLVFEQAVHPLLQAGARPSLVVRDMNYSVLVHLNQRAEVASQTLGVHSVETVSIGHRILPHAEVDGTFWISAARTERALATEFAAVGCLARELVTFGNRQLSDADWVSAVKSLCHVAVTVNGDVQELHYDDTLDDADQIVRWSFRPESTVPGVRIPVQVSFDFPIPRDENRFPVIFSSYYCAGATVVNFKVYEGEEPVTLTFDSFFAKGLSTTSNSSPSVPARGSLSQQLSFSTGNDSILWPGSGVVFSWLPVKPR